MVQRNNNNRISDQNKTCATKKVVVPSRQSRFLQTSPSLRTSLRSSQEASPLNIRTDPTPFNQTPLSATAAPNSTQMTSRSNSDFPVASSDRRFAANSASTGRASRIPLFAAKSGHFTSQTRRCSPALFDSDNLSDGGLFSKFKLRRRATLSSRSASHVGSQSLSVDSPVGSEKTFPEDTPLPLLRATSSLPVHKDSGQDSTVSREGDGTPMGDTQYSLSSTGTCMTETTHQQMSRPNSTMTSASTTASLRDRHESIIDSKPTSLLLTPSTADTLRMSAREIRRLQTTTTPLPVARVYQLRSAFLIFLIFSLCACGFLVSLLNQFSSGRCWTTSNTSSPLPQRRTIVCSDDSILRFTPHSLRDHLHLQVREPKLQPFSKSTISKVVLDASNTSLQHIHRLFIRMARLFELLSLPQQLASSLRKVADKIDGSEQLLHAVKMQTPATVDMMHDIQDRIAVFESSGLIEKELLNSTSSRSLREHTNEFRERIEHVIDNVFVAIGYGLANVVLIDTNAGLILFDTLENPLNMRRVMDEWMTMQRKSSSPPSSPSMKLPPVLAIVYSHFHQDHVFGASAVYQPGVTQIWAHETTDIEITKSFTMTAGSAYKRAMRQFGSLLSEEDGYLNAGIGLRLDYRASELASAVRPTHIWKGDRTTIEIGGETLELIHAPGESRDQSIVWLPKKQLLFGADNIYKTMPNIYAIRGTESRDAMVWVRSLDIMRELRPDVLVLGHTGVLRGRELIHSTITAYRDAIQYIHDQTVRYMNKGRPVDDIVEIVKLPPHLRSHPYLQPYYGTVEWAVRAVFHHYVGWFSGLSEELHSLSRSEKASKMAQLVGGRIQLLQRSVEALEKKEYQWALELVSHAQLLSPSCETTRKIKTNILRILATTQSSAPGRNWYLTAAREAAEFEDPHTAVSPSHHPDYQLKQLYQKALQGGKILRHHLSEVLGRRLSVNQSQSDSTGSHSHRPKISDQLKVTKSQKNQCIKNLKSAVEIFSFIPIRLRAEAALNIDSVLAFTFTDTKQFACIHFRRGVAYATPKCERVPDYKVYTTDATWRLIITYELRPVVAVTTGKLRLDSKDPLDYLRLKRLLGLIEIDME